MRTLLLLLGTATLIACSPVTDPGSGEAIDGGVAEIDATVDCEESNDCGGGLTPICDDVSSTCQACTDGSECVALGGLAECSSTGACVECTEDTHCTTPAAAICDSDETCRGCQSNDECDSGACNFDSGVCVNGSNVVYVNGTGGANAGTCTQSLPCLTINYGLGRLSDTRNTLILAAGTYSERVVTSQSGPDIRIIGYGAVIDGSSVGIGQSDKGLVEIGHSTHVVIEGLEVKNSQAAGIHCKGTLAAGLTSVALHDVRISGAEGPGLSQENICDGFMHQLTLTSSGTGNGASAIAWAGGELRIDRSNIFGNTSTALYTDDAKLTLLNSQITNNGSENYDRIISIRGDGNQPVVMRYNTIAANAPGCVPTVQYATTDQPVAFNSNIVYNNIVTCSGNVDPNGSAPTDNIIEPTDSQVMVPVGNLSDDPLFVNLGTGDYSLQATSVGVDKGVPANAPDHDYNGAPRPLGTAPDIGAIESH